MKQDRNHTTLIMARLMAGVTKRRKFLKQELRRINLQRYLIKLGWPTEEIFGIIEASKTGFLSGITYASIVFKKHRLRPPQKTQISLFIKNIAACYE